MEVKDSLIGFIHSFIHSADGNLNAYHVPGSTLGGYGSNTAGAWHSVHPTGRENKKPVDPWMKKLICGISFPHIFQLLLSWGLFFFLCCFPFPSQARLERAKICDEVLLSQTVSRENGGEEAASRAPELDNLPNTCMTPLTLVLDR